MHEVADGRRLAGCGAGARFMLKEGRLQEGRLQESGLKESGRGQRVQQRPGVRHRAGQA
jgi:hypothetical protein